MPKTLSITSGEYRGRKIIAPDTDKTHPMGSREKLALFNAVISVFGPLEDAGSVLDAFCGSGALGLEALSRGAKKAIFIDNSKAAIKATKDNIAALGLEQRTDVLKTDVKFYQSNEQFSLILIDPPYDSFYRDDFEHLSKQLATDGVLVLSHPGSIDPAQVFQDLDLISTKKYADANISIYKHK